MVVRIDPHATSSFVPGFMIQIPTLPLVRLTERGINADQAVVQIEAPRT